MAAHQHWRFYVRRSAGNGSIRFGEIEMREAIGGVDACVGGTPSLSHAPSAGVVANAFANDGNTTFVTIADPYDVWIAYDFGAGNEKDIVEVSLIGNATTNMGPGDWEVQYSDDGVNWTTAWRILSITGWVNGVVRSFAKPVLVGDAARYWRVAGDRVMWGDLSHLWRCSEMRMFTAVGGANECTGGTPIGHHGGTSGLGLANAFDGVHNVSLYWNGASVSTGDSGSSYLGYDFGVDKAIVEVQAQAVGGSSEGWRSFPTTGRVEASPDGINWLPMWSFTEMGHSLEYNARYIKPSAIPAPAPGTRRFWGIRITATQTPASPALVGLIALADAPAGATLATDITRSLATRMTNSSSYRSYYAWDIAAGDWQGLTNNGGGDILAYDFDVGTEHAIPVELRLTADGGAFAQMPTAFDLVYSDNGFDWVTQESFVTPATWVGSETRTFAITPISAGGSRGRQIMIGN